MPDPHTSASKIAARLFDFWHRRTPWHRRLWAIGTVSGLREVAEYSEVRRAGNLPAEGLLFVCQSMRREVDRDPAAAPFSAEIAPLLDKGSSMTAHDELTLRHLAERAEDSYLLRWAAAVESAGPPGVEFTARAVASHLLDRGFSADHLYRWLDAKRHQAQGPLQLGPLLRDADAMCAATAAKTYRVVVPCFTPGPPDRLPPTTKWLDSEEMARWLDEHHPDAPGLRQGGAFEFSLSARDPWAAIEVAADLVARVAARVQVGRPGTETMRAVGPAFVVGNTRRFDLRSPRRQVEIHALDRQGALYDIDLDRLRQLDDALELAAYMETGTPGAAVTGGWAAIEGLLLYPGERGHAAAADRMATLIACSLPRAELTPLAYRHAEHGADQLAEQLRQLGASSRNYERVRIVEDRLRAGGGLTLGDPSDEAALDRLTAILADPQGELERIRVYVSECLRRLYNQRNLVMHSGSFRSVALAATLRTAPSLVGAGLDRIVHSQLANEPPVEPLALVARAEAELALLGTAGASRLVDLLE